MDRENANSTRLRVNRINLIQKLDSNELVPKLVKLHILDNENQQQIQSGTSRIDRARRLIDCLLDKKDKPKNWYLQFRSILQENQTYQELIVSLDNTIIRTPDFALQAQDAFHTKHSEGQVFRDIVNDDLLKPRTPKQTNNDGKSSAPKTNQESITNIEFDPYDMKKILIEGQFQKVIDNLNYHSQVPEKLFQTLSESSLESDQQQLQMEKEVYDDMRRLELMDNLIKKEKALANQCLFETRLVDHLLEEKEKYHLFYKYFHYLSAIYGHHIDQEFFKSYHKLTQQHLTDDTVKHLTTKGFLLYDFLFDYGKYDLCHQLAELMIQMLTKYTRQANQPSAALLMSSFDVCCKLIKVHNVRFEIKQAWTRIEAAAEIAETIKSGSKNVDFTPLYCVASQTAFEDANFDAALQYAYRGLKIVDKADHKMIVELLCNTAQALTSKWIMNKAQSTVLMAVQYARKYCGQNSPQYLKALQQLVQFSNEFIQDKTTLDLAQYAFDRARIITGYESLPVAHCHRSVSKSYITMKNFDSDLFLQHANEAYRIAQDWFGVNDVKLLPFKLTLANAFQAKANNILQQDKNSGKLNYFNEALQLVQESLKTSEELFGTMSFKVAQVHRLISSTYLSKKMFSEAEHHLNTCVQIYKLCLPPNSFHYLVTRASLGLLYKQQNDLARALKIFQEIAQSLDTKTQSFRWINMVLENLIECYTNLNDEENAVKVREEFTEWKQSHKRLNLFQEINNEPRSLQQFLHDSTRFENAKNKVAALMFTQNKARTKATTNNKTET